MRKKYVIEYDENQLQTILGQRANRDTGLNAPIFTADVRFIYADKKAVVTLKPIKPQKEGEE